MDPVALVCAMPSELRHALARLDGVSESYLGPWQLYRGSIQGCPVVTLATGIGLVNAAAAMSALATTERLSAVANFGCAGAHRADIQPGDVVIGTGVVAYGSLTILPTGEERYAGFRCEIDGEAVVTDTLLPDPTLTRLAIDAAIGWEPDRWPATAEGGRAPSVHTGIIASADCWTQHAQRIGILHERYGSLCEEMETAAIAQVCQRFQLPWLAIKDISNNELIAATDHGEDGPTLSAIRDELGMRAFALVERVLARFAAV